jgi:outer membrane receptor protein involved in Fe transport
LWFLNTQYTRDLGSGFSFTTNGYGRFLQIEQFNRDVEEDLLANTQQDGWGGSAQLTYQNTLLGMPATAATGLDYSGATLRHRIAERDLPTDIGFLSSGLDDISGFQSTADVTSETHSGGAFLTATLEPIQRLSVTASGRFDTTALQISDQLAKRDPAKLTDASGSHRFEHFDPALGATYTLPYGFNLYANYSQSYRVPTAIELTCANPAAPCPIPTALIEDPPLKPVKGKTWETGLRWSLLANLHATLSFFRTDLSDDILFLNGPQSRTLGFFQNVKATRRQGIELQWRGAWSGGHWFANYTMTDATFETDTRLFTFANADHAAFVQKGDSLPLVPNHRLNGGVEFQLSPQWRLQLDAAYVGSQYLRGDEANQHQRLDPYFVANARVSYTYGNAEIFFRLENMFDSAYETYGAFAENQIDQTGIERFLGPGAPLGAFGGVRLTF